MCRQYRWQLNWRILCSSLYSVLRILLFYWVCRNALVRLYIYILQPPYQAVREQRYTLHAVQRSTAKKMDRKLGY